MECVKDLVFRVEPVEVKKHPRHVSRFANQVREEVMRKKDCHRTFGLPLGSIEIKPLKKRSEKKPRQGVREKCPDRKRSQLKPPLPEPIRGETRRKEDADFILRNKAWVSLRSAGEGERRVFDTASARRARVTSLSAPNFVLARKFGRVPNYLRRRKKEEKAKECQESVPEKESFMIQLLSSKEREQLIQGLKEKWKAVSWEYQSLPLVTDTRRSERRKQGLEEELDLLERHLALLELNNNILVKGGSQT